MLANSFEKPLEVFVGLGFPCQLNTVVDAYRFAMEWCGDSPEQRAAVRACRAALTGEIDAETARGVFVAFARKKDILLEDQQATLPREPSVQGAVTCETERGTGASSNEARALSYQR